MTHCPNCNEEVPAGARFCPRCGWAQPRRPPREDSQPPLPFSPWGPPSMAMQTAGAGSVARAEPVVGPPLSLTTVGIVVGAIMLFLLVVFLFERSRMPVGAKPGVQAGTPSAPVVGIKGEAITVGKTTWGVAFTDQVKSIDSRQPQRGQFFAVGIVIGNKGAKDLALTTESVGLIEESNHTSYRPTMTAWGTPNEITSGQYTTRYTLPPRKAIAGLIIFDVPKALPQPRLLVRDLSTSSTNFTGAIDLTKEKTSEGKGGLLRYSGAF